MYPHQGQLTNRQFRQYCDIVYRQCGIILNEDKRELLSARLGRRLRVLGMQAGKYLELIHSDTEEMEKFVDAISTNHTFFFRESGAFDIISSGCRDIWCAASSSGEEPYSLASYCHHHGIQTTILATDISRSCLEKGRKGLYPIDSGKHIPTPILKQCFQRGIGQWSGFLRVKPQIKKNVRFERFNLLTDQVPNKMFDIIFCRNVMIYFDLPTKEKVVHKLCSTLNQGGHFVIGGAESLNGLSHTLKYMAPSVYRKR
ncbi:MAG: protein-glutamate O-methyltransferase CheR, partial [Desulfobacteraceae bacterium]